MSQKLKAVVAATGGEPVLWTAAAGLRGQEGACISVSGTHTLQTIVKCKRKWNSLLHVYHGIIACVCVCVCVVNAVFTSLRICGGL